MPRTGRNGTGARQASSGLPAAAVPRNRLPEP